MDPKRPWECADMSEVRREIDRLDDELVDLIAARFGYVERAWQLKKNPADATVPWRIEQVIERVQSRAREREMPELMVEMIGGTWRNMIGWFVQYEEEKLTAGSKPGADKGEASS